MKQKRIMVGFLGSAILLLVLVSGLALAHSEDDRAQSLGSSFIYQGRLQQAGAPIAGDCEMSFDLYYDETSMMPIASITSTTVPVSNGFFATELDFGAGTFTNHTHWLEIQVQCAGDSVPIDMGRQELVPIPHALYASAASWDGLGGMPADLADGDDVDDTVAWSEISGMVGSGPNQVALGSHAHDVRYYTQSELQTSGLAQVHWGNVTVVPTEWSDGDDVDDTVAWSEISGIVGTGSNQVAVGDHEHDGRYYSHSALQTSGQASVHWVNLLLGSIPAGFADDVDNEADDYPQVVDVAQSGGDFVSVQAAISSITDAAADKQYLVRIMPGIYHETVSLKPYVHLLGAGQEATVITSDQDTSWPPTQATLVLTDHVSLRELTVNNTGAGERNVAILATAGATETLISDVTIHATGTASLTYNYAIYLSGSDTGISLQRVTAQAAEGDDYNYALYVDDGQVTITGGTFIAQGGRYAYGIYSKGSGARLEASNVLVASQNGSLRNYGLYNYDGAYAKLDRCRVVAQAGGDAYAIRSLGNGATLEAQYTVAVAQDASDDNVGLFTGNQVTLRGGSFSGQGGADAWGIYAFGSSANVVAEGVMVLGENGSATSYGLYNEHGDIELLGGSFTGRGGADAFAIRNEGINAELFAQEVTALGADGVLNCGFYNHDYSQATLVGGSYTAEGGGEAIGLANVGNQYAWLDAWRVTAEGRGASVSNLGLYNTGSSATSMVSQSTLSGSSHAASRSQGLVTVSNSRLNGGAVNGTVSCVLTTRNTSVQSSGVTCP